MEAEVLNEVEATSSALAFEASDFGEGEPFTRLVGAACWQMTPVGDRKSHESARIRYFASDFAWTLFSNDPEERVRIPTSLRALPREPDVCSEISRAIDEFSQEQATIDYYGAAAVLRAREFAAALRGIAERGANPPDRESGAVQRRADSLREEGKPLVRSIAKGPASISDGALTAAARSMATKEGR